MDARHGCSGSLWAISSYFNPAGYRRRLANYQIFRQSLVVPLVTVELSFTGTFDLCAGDAEVLVQLQGNDVMWQKERLLNIALGALPSQCQKVVWMDCDILFDSADWAEEVSRALEEFALVQPFSRIGHLDSAGSSRMREVVVWQSGLACAVASGQTPLAALRLTDPASLVPTPRSATDEQYRRRVATIAQPGMAWAARRDMLARFSLHDACIVGGADVCIAGAAYGCFREVADTRGMTGPERERYLAWAEPFHGAVRASVAHVEGDLYHLWHGDLRDRHYIERHQQLSRFYFDPLRDIALADNQVWRWNSDKPLLHAYVRDYFASRKEDG